ncbi:portal protein, HK97 family, putative [Sagittula stellata E-37]|uniref:Portal protein, HK97 family, putative n=1 Tax=Sagittula stellata (strain ATCC 700073 / DSM 11524 / E-37) TaxID=388399 RepID=A3KA51_SAGS3|nr:portal protein, HK97 family, putative [Sagittula stellata E-37]
MDLFRGRGNAATSASVRAEPPLTASATSSVQSATQWSNGFVTAGPSRAGVAVNEQAALSIPATLQALRVLTGVFAMTPLHAYQRTDKGRKPADNLPGARLFRDDPNSHQTPFGFMELAMADLMLAGDFFAYISRGAGFQPRALTRLKPGTTVIAQHFDRQDGVTLFYDATLPDGTRERFPSRDILHVPGFTRDGINGLNPVRYARDALGSTIATSQHTADFWARGGKPSTVLQSEQRISREDKAEIRSDWQRLYGGLSGESVAVLDQDLKAEFLTHNMQENQMIETRQFQVVDLARIWGVPPHLIFDLSRSTFSNIEQQSLEFVIYHLGPHYTRFAQAITKAFAPEGHYFEHLTDALTRGDIKSRMQAYWLQRQMGMANANELRRLDNLPEIEGGAGSDYWRPSNMEVAGQPTANRPGTMPGADGDNDPEDDDVEE